MRGSSKSETTGTIARDFFNRNCTTFEIYYRLRIKGFNQSFAHNLLHKWLDERAILEARTKKGKE